MDMEEHVWEHCDRRPVTCHDCGAEVAWSELDSHSEYRCPCTEVQCPHDGCSVHLPHRDVESHLSNDCSQQRVTCRHAWLGCTERLRRQDLDERRL